MIVDKTNGYLDEVKEFSKKIKKEEQLQRELDYLDNYAEHSTTRCQLHRDFAPYSLSFVMEILKDGEYKYWFNGGLIFHGSHDNGGDGGFPTLSVCLSPCDGWSIHT